MLLSTIHNTHKRPAPPEFVQSPDRKLIKIDENSDLSEEHIDTTNLNADKINLYTIVFESKLDLLLSVIKFEGAVALELSNDALLLIKPIFCNTDPAWAEKVEKYKQSIFEAIEHLPGYVACRLTDRVTKLMRDS